MSYNYYLIGIYCDDNKFYITVIDTSLRDVIDHSADEYKQIITKNFKNRSKIFIDKFTNDDGIIEIQENDIDKINLLIILSINKDDDTSQKKIFINKIIYNNVLLVSKLSNKSDDPDFVNIITFYKFYKTIEDNLICILLDKIFNKKDFPFSSISTSNDDIYNIHKNIGDIDDAISFFKGKNMFNKQITEFERRYQVAQTIPPLKPL